MARLVPVLVIALGLFSAAAAVDTNPDEVRLARFLAGIEVLRSTTLESGAEKVAKYKQLKKLTGLENAQVVALIDRYRNDPDGWNRVVQKVRELLENQ